LRFPLPYLTWDSSRKKHVGQDADRAPTLGDLIPARRALGQVLNRAIN